MDKFLQYDHNDFAQESSFINYVKKSSKQDQDFWSQWIDDYPDKKEEVEKAEKIVAQIVFKEQKPNKAVEDKIWSRIAAETKAETKGGKEFKINPDNDRKSEGGGGGGIIRKLFAITAVAASLIAVIFIYQGNDLDTISTQLAEMKTVNLPDGSVVNLNADTEIAYDKDSWNENRLIELEGEAFFSVEKGSKFQVKTPTGTVAVLGTSFNVFARDKELKVHCETGKVAVKSASKESILTPNEKVEVINGNHSKSSNVGEKENRSAWRKAVYSYDGNALEDVIEDLERQFGLKIEIDDNLKSEKYTGFFEGKDAKKAIESVCWTMKYKPEINGKNIKISK